MSDGGRPTPAPVLARRGAVRLRADPARVITRLFVPGQEGFDHQRSRTSAVLGRVMALDEGEVEGGYADLLARFAGHHRDLEATFARHADELADRVAPERPLTTVHRLLLGATFTNEYAVEAAALCNPSLVAHPDQAGVVPGGLRVVMSVRGIGEGHLSSIGFRTGVVDAAGELDVDPVAPYATTGATGPTPFDRDVFRDELERLGADGEDVDDVLDALGDRFTSVELEARLDRLRLQARTRRTGARTIALLERIAERSYEVRFDPATELSERVLWPATPPERRGIEDARFVRFVDDDGSVTYQATYTAYDGHEVSQQLLVTEDFVDFTSSPIVGAAAANKGLALFPRRVGGRYAALTRWDRESNGVSFSDHPARWAASTTVQVPCRPWEVLQLGNCGPPIETPAGWLVLTHGVGPMRTYSIGAVLLDLEDPTRLIGHLREPLLAPTGERGGYVPNVVYSCGGLVHAGALLVPHGIGDAAIGVATVPLDELLAALTSA